MLDSVAFYQFMKFTVYGYRTALHIVNQLNSVTEHSQPTADSLSNEGSLPSLHARDIKSDPSVVLSR